MEKSTFVSIIIVSFNTRKLLLSCIESIYEYVHTPFEIIIVDNNSSDSSVLSVKKLKRQNIHIISNTENVGFAKANNQGFKKARGNYILLLNSDTLLTEDCVTPSATYLDSHARTGILSCSLKNEDGSVQPTGGYFPTLFRVFLWISFLDDIPFFNYFFRSFHPKERIYSKAVKLDWITGAYFFMRAELLESVGMLDEDYFMYVEELDYCYRVKEKGWDIDYIPRGNIIHFGRSSGSNEFAILSELKNLVLFYRKHYSILVPLLRVVLKIGALGRVVLFAILGESRKRDIYAKAFFVV